MRKAAPVSMELIPQIGAEERLATTMAGGIIRREGASRKSESARNRAAAGSPPAQGSKHLVSGRWLISAAVTTIAAAALCTWIVLCLLFWQGSWQLLYHPAAAITRTPSAAGIQFEPVAFAVTDEGIPRLKGWWIPAAPDAAQERYTFLYFHGAYGNLSNSVDALARLHAIGVNVLAFDYRGYGQSQYARPGETHWRQDAESALQYLIATRHIDSGSIVLDGEGLGADLALEIAAEHRDLAGVIVQSPLDNPAVLIFDDPRSSVVPAHLLAGDRYDLDDAAQRVQIPVLWLQPSESSAPNSFEPLAFRRISATKQLVRILIGTSWLQQTDDAQSNWLKTLPPD